MRAFVVVLALFALGEATPHINFFAPVDDRSRLGGETQIIGGSDAQAGAWPWQLSQQRRSGSGSWSHSCGASLLSSNRALSAAHCVDGATPSVIRVIAGLQDRSNTAGTQTSDSSRLVMHERYQVDSASYSNDIAIIHLETAITTGSRVEFLTLPPNNNNNFAGTTCTITGWGRTSSSNALPDTLQQANIQVITTSQCQARMTGVSGVEVWDNHFCLYDSANNIGSCNGDSGGPCNCPDGSGGYYVAGVTSWGISNILGNCLQTYPSVYTRTSAYLAWIANN